MNVVGQQISALYFRLSRREQRIIAVLAVLLALIMLHSLIISPIWRTHARLQRGIDNLQTDIVAMQALQRRIQALQTALGSRAGQVADGKDFSLFSFIDRVTAAAVENDNIDSMNPSRRQRKPGLDEMVVDLRLSRVTLAAVVSMLRNIEESGRPVYVKQLELKRRYDDKTRFDVILTTATLVDNRGD